MKKPKISLGSWAFSFGPFEDKPWSFDEVAEFTAKANYDGIEINGFLPHPHPDVYNTPEKCKELMEQLNELGLGLSAYAPNFTAVPPSLCEKSEYLTVLKKYLWFCNECKIKLLRVDTVVPPEEKNEYDYNKQYNNLVLNWRAAAAAAKKSGITIVWEFEPGFWLNKPSEVKKLVDDISCSNFKLLFDTSHAYMGSVIGARQTGEKEILSGGMVEYAKLLLNDIGHLHLIDSNGKLHNEETSVHESFGKGYVNFEEVLKVLQPILDNIEFICVDFCFNPDTPNAAKEAVPFINNLLES